MKIYKYAVPVDDSEHDIKMPSGSTIVHVDSQGDAYDMVYFWAMFHTGDLGTPTRKFMVFPTGFPVPEQWKYVGTAKVANGSLMWHLFEYRT